MRRQSKIKVAPYKQTLKNLNAWEKDAIKYNGKEYNLTDIHNLQNQLTPYLTKKGNVKKNLSQKRTKEFNALIEEIKKNPFSTRKKRKAYKEKTKQSNEKRYNTGVERGTYRDKDHYENAQVIFESALYKELHDKGYLDSDQVIDLSQEMDEYTEDDIQKAFEYVLNTMDANIPEEIKNSLDRSDGYTLAQIYLEGTKEGIDFSKMQPSLLADILASGRYFEYLEMLRQVLNGTDYELQYIDSINTLEKMYKELQK